MRKRTLGFLFLFFLHSFCLWGQDSAVLTGQVRDQSTQRPLPYATIVLAGTRTGTHADANGRFSFPVKQKPPFKLVIRYVGYNDLKQEITTLTFQEFGLTPLSIQAQEVVITASRVVEKSLESPITIEQVDARALRQTPAPTFFEALEGVKGVQMTTASLGFKVPNTRGFTNPTNVRFLQLVDGVDNQAPVIGASIANAAGPSELDLEKIEVTPGTASAMYGMNSLNGLVNFFTKSPFDYQGVSVYQRTGLNHVNDSQTKAHLLSESAFRYAKAFQNRWAFKVNVSYLRGYDCIALQTMDLNPKGNASVNLLETDNPAQDPVSSYGNEGPNRRTLTLNGKNYVVARTGYYEQDITDYTLENLKADAALHYRFSPNWEVAYSYRWGKTDNVYQRTNRFRLDDYTVGQHVVQLKGERLQVKAYLTRELSGDSYNIRSLAENLDRRFKSDSRWFQDYSAAYLASTSAGFPVAESHQRARAGADAGRLEPGTARYDSAVHQIIGINNWDVGAALRTKATLLHAEGQYDLRNQIKFMDVLVGADYRLYSVFPDGNYFINPKEAGHNLLYRKGGGFVQLSKKLLQDRLHLQAALRYDQNEYFKGIFNPRIAAVYQGLPGHYFRLSYQNGYRFPSLFEAFSNVNSGGVKRVGGLPVMSNGIFEDSYICTSIDAFTMAVNQQVNQQGVALPVAIRQNAGLLKKSPYDYIQPERINSWEVGYKSLTLDNRLAIDADFYFNVYRHFMAQVEVNQVTKRSVPPDSVPFYLYDRSKQERYRLWTNSTSTVYNYGSSLGVKYNFYRNYSLAGNGSYAKLHRKAFNDGLEEAFNTPTWITNLSLSNPTIAKNVGFQVNWHWQAAFLWQSSLGTGPVLAYHSLDAQVNVKIPSAKVLVKVGATNLLNHSYYQMVAGPSIGGLYYVTLLFDELLR
ncbi:TonB-dependent receptor [Adhaeribacter radiodurans]|uniref:TonB-dependent receptor n=1 Tax=Adhaeribacter radiodurans TaxID=2745197 RepID=A0A7L7L5F8_9BACT|nr:TonB-dependent receptor [Adhaeribacter radiodurans]QMU27845.1 TonB-dependent receptor [Adhaeribacter radiodurans]